jgi:serine/threonine protein kinase
MTLDPIEAILAAEDRCIGPFRLRNRLGSGGFAPVYLAAETYGEDVLRTVAIKLFIAPRVAPALGGGIDPRVRESLVHEARALCRVEHPNVVRFHQIAEAAGGQLLALVMELVRGTSVAAMLEAQPTLSVSTSLDIGIAVASALAAVHRAGLVHRDVKPQNVVESQGVYKLIDFGIAAGEIAQAGPLSSRARVSVNPSRASSARVVVAPVHPSFHGPAASAATFASGDALAAATGNTMNASAAGSPHILAGTMGYIDPVTLCERAPATAASDLYALGCMLYECLTGRLPSSPAEGGFDRLLVEVMTGHRSAPPIRQIEPMLSKPLADLIDALVAPTREARPKSAEWVLAELERVRRLEDGTTMELPSEDEGPFRGLDCFEPQHRAVFLGRSTEVASALETLRMQGLLVVVGASGSGKSSLARAAILPSIVEGKLGGWPTHWDSVVATPGADARVALVTALGPYVRATDDHDPEALVAVLVKRAEQTGRGMVILVDQLEELVTQGNMTGRRFAIELLALLAERPLPGVRAVVGLRRDFLDPLLAEEDLGRVLGRNMLLVSPLTLPVWRDIVLTGVGRYGYTIDDETMTEVTGQLKEMESAMPLVQFALSKLWQRRDRERRIIPREALHAIGGITGALEMHAEELVAKLVAQHGPGALVALERATMVLTTPQGTRLQVDEAALIARIGLPVARDVVGALEAARLVVREGTFLAFTHDAVIGGWRRLADWIRKARADREIAADLEAQAARWSTKRERELLWTKRQLAAARALVSRGVIQLSDGAHNFVRAARHSEIRRIVAGVMLVFLVLTAAGLALGLFESSRRHSQDNRAEYARVQADIQNHRIYAIEALQTEITGYAKAKEACMAARAQDAAQFSTAQKAAEADRLECSRTTGQLSSQRAAAVNALQRCERMRSEVGFVGGAHP